MAPENSGRTLMASLWPWVEHVSLSLNKPLGRARMIFRMPISTKEPGLSFDSISPAISPSGISFDNDIAFESRIAESSVNVCVVGRIARARA